MGKDNHSSDEDLLFLSIPFDATNSEKTARFIKLLEAGIDWNYLDEKLIKYRLSGFFFQNVKNTNTSHLIPPEILKHFSIVMKNDFVLNLLYLEVFKDLTKTFLENKIDCILLKGMALYFTVYAKSKFRFMYDIDLLVKEAQYEKVKNILGYSDMECNRDSPPKFDVYQQFCYMKKTEFKEIKVDIHRALIKGVRYGYFNNDKVWRNSVVFEAGTLKMRILSPEFQLMHLCTNLVKNFHSRQAYVICFCDIAEAVEFYHMDFKWETFLGLIKEERVEDEVYSVLSWLYKYGFINVPEIVEKKLSRFSNRIFFQDSDVSGFGEYSQAKFSWHLISNVPGVREKLSLINGYIFPPLGQLNKSYPRIPVILVYFYYWYRVLKRISKIIGYSLRKSFSKAA
jgi:hypothetical protein